MDRLNSREETSFNPKFYAEGSNARMEGKALADNPYRVPNGKYIRGAASSWAAGWCDGDKVAREE